MIGTAVPRACKRHIITARHTPERPSSQPKSLLAPISGASASVVDGGRCDPERAEVDVALTAVMDLVVDDVQDQVVQRVGVLAESCHGLLEPIRRDLSPERLELLRALVPEPQD